MTFASIKDEKSSLEEVSGSEVDQLLGNAGDVRAGVELGQQRLPLVGCGMSKCCFHEGRGRIEFAIKRSDLRGFDRIFGLKVSNLPLKVLKSRLFCKPRRSFAEGR